MPDALPAQASSIRLYHVMAKSTSYLV